MASAAVLAKQIACVVLIAVAPLAIHFAIATSSWTGLIVLVPVLQLLALAAFAVWRRPARLRWLGPLVILAALGIAWAERMGFSLTAMPGAKVPCPWIGQAPAAFECRHHTTLSIGNSREIILGEIVYAHFRGDTVDERLHVDPAALDAVGRMGGHGYATTRDYFDLPTMPLATWRNDPDAANRRS